MIKKTLLIAALFASIGATAQTLAYKERARQYVLKFKDLAQEEQRRSGIPAAITLGQGILETEAGNSELATQANNHFGIKCKKAWTGETFAHDDDAPQECFRKYPSAEHSYRDHSDYLKTSKRYEPCFAQSPTDYASWAKQLRKCGYATNPKYAQILIRIIEDYQLQDYTYAAMKSPSPVLIASAASPVAAAMMAEKAGASEVIPDHDTPTENKDNVVYGTLTHKDGVKGFYAHKGDVLLEYAIKFKMRYAKLLEINHLPDAPLSADMFVSLENGNTIQQIISRDASEPTPAVAYSGPERGAVLSSDPVEAQPMANAQTPAANPQSDAVTPVAAAAQAPENNAATETKPVATAAVITEQQNEAPAAAPVTATIAPAVEAPKEEPVKAEPIKEEPVKEAPVAAETTAAVVATNTAPTPPPAVVVEKPVVAAIATQEPAQPANQKPTSTGPAGKPYNIASEVAVGEDGDDDDDNAKTKTAANPAEPKDEFARLKERLDKVVYAPRKSTAAPASAPAPATASVAKPATVTPAAATPAAVTSAAPAADAKAYHTVKAGETAFGISKKYGITMKELMAMNNLNFEAIKVGQKLRVK